MTELCKFSNIISVNKNDISKIMGINLSRLSELFLKESARLTAEEFYLIAIDLDPTIILNGICKYFKLVKR